MLDKFEKFFALAITAIVLLSLAFVAGRLTKDCEKTTVELQPRFTIDSVEDIKVKDSIITKTDTFHSTDTVKVYQDYFKAKKYDLEFSNNITGSATVSENSLDSFKLNDSLLEQNKKPAEWSMSAGATVVGLEAFGPSISVSYKRHSATTGYMLNTNQVVLSYHYEIF